MSWTQGCICRGNFSQPHLLQGWITISIRKISNKNILGLSTMKHQLLLSALIEYDIFPGRGMSFPTSTSSTRMWSNLWRMGKKWKMFETSLSFQAYVDWGTHGILLQEFFVIWTFTYTWNLIYLHEVSSSLLFVTAYWCHYSYL